MLESMHQDIRRRIAVQIFNWVTGRPVLLIMNVFEFLLGIEKHIFGNVFSNLVVLIWSSGKICVLVYTEQFG